MGLRELALFAGAGGGILGGHLLGWKTVAACEIEEYPRAVLLRRQLDGILPKFPIWDDIRTFDGKPFRGRVDIITGGFPCQDISAAGKGAGIDGERSGLWSEMFRVVCEVRPRFVFVENSPMLTSRGLHRVLGDLAKIGYYAEWLVLGADDIGAPHRRKRIWILGYTSDYGQLTAEERKSIIERSNGSKTGTEQACKPERSGAAGHKEEMADSSCSRSNKDTRQGKLWADRIEQSSKNKGIANKSEKREIKKMADSHETYLQRRRISGGIQAEHNITNRRGNLLWWDTDPADLPDTRQEHDNRNAGRIQEDQTERTSSTIYNQSSSEGQGKNRPAKSRLDGMVDELAYIVDEHETNGFKYVPRVAHKNRNRVDRLKAIGNGQVPGVAAVAFLILYNRMNRNK